MVSQSFIILTAKSVVKSRSLDSAIKRTAFIGNADHNEKLQIVIYPPDVMREI